MDFVIMNDSDIPPEILVAIVMHCVQDTIAIPPHLTEPPWTLLRVSSRWRSLVLATPAIWCRLGFDLRGLIDPAPRIALGRELLQFSGSLPLSISNTVNIMETAMFDTSATYVQDFLVPVSVSSRLQSLHFHGGAESLEPFLALPAGSLPLLEDLEIIVNKRALQRDLWSSEATAFQGATRLRKVMVRGLYQSINPNLFRFPWDQLRDFHLRSSYASADHLRGFLPHCTNLTSLTIGVSGTTHSRIPITLPTLTSLDIKIETLVACILLQVDCPNLEYLTLRMAINFWDVGPFKVFARRCCNHVKGLGLFFMISSADEVGPMISQVLSELSSLDAPITDLKLICPRLTSIPFTQLSQHILPTLQYFTSIVNSFDLADAFLDTVQELKPAHAVMIPTCGLRPVHYGRIGDLVRDGLRVEVSSVSSEWEAPVRWFV
ncbi:hypothetical protein BDN72DRAFT_846175 [Pluteus cervinus]|uniref:Uncharacterized protein n=1 Tax=Pluteus cervinus TaxID=181527 RepID=A0ACD3AHH9_9AGAR|nr:hypothetical protein BDN72DRAFT_846175 [Pluteus cervinus]